MNHSTWTTKLVLLIAILVFLFGWHIVALLVHAQVILPGPAKTLMALWEILGSSPFALNIWATVLRALVSFVIILVTGTLLGIAAGYSRHVHQFLKPLLAVCKATPVMAVILLAFIWFTSATVPLFSAFLMGFPIMFIQVVNGVRSISSKLEEMTKIYGLTKKDRLLHLTIPSLAPHIITGAKSSLSMVWKVVIAAEVLTVPRYGVGSRMQLSQVNLETDRVLAWTLIAVFLTVATDILFEAGLRLPKQIKRMSHKKLASNMTMAGTGQ